MPSVPVSVIISVYNGGATFRRCLEALMQTTYPQWECLVVDDGSDDGSDRLAAEFGARVLRSEYRRSGPARARNLGAQAAAGEILFFIDADVLVRPETVGQVAAVLHGDPGLAAVFGSYDDRPPEPHFLSQYRNLQHHYVHQVSNPSASTFWSGCGGIRRQIFLEMGGFSTHYGRPSIEDIELGYRLKAAGCEIRLEKSIQVSHMKRWSARKLIVTDIRDRAIPWTQLILSHQALPNDLNLKSDQRLSALALFAGLGFFTLAPLLNWLLLLATLACMVVLLVLNRPFYHFLRIKRGSWFALRAIPWHWLYFLYSGLCFAGCLLWYRVLGKPNPAARRPTPVTPLAAALTDNHEHRLERESRQNA